MVESGKVEPEKTEAEDLFSSMSEVTPLSDDELDELDDDEHGTLEERMEGARKLTDLQVADQRLNPDLGFKHLNVIQMSRTFPDVYDSLFRILVKDLIKKSLASGLRLSVAEAMATVNTALSISIDGEGRFDEIAIMGKSAVAAEEEKTKTLGLG